MVASRRAAKTSSVVPPRAGAIVPHAIGSTIALSVASLDSGAGQMWWCPEGERVLRGAEWDLFRVGLSTLWDVEDGCHVERRGPGWVVVDAEGSCLNEVERFVWSPEEPLFFKTQAAAHAAYLQARGDEEGRKMRYREAMKRLGRPLRGPSRYEESTLFEGC